MPKRYAVGTREPTPDHPMLEFAAQLDGTVITHLCTFATEGDAEEAFNVMLDQLCLDETTPS